MVDVSQVLDNSKGIVMIEKMLLKHKDQLPTEKSIKDFGGGYVEVLKTKAKVILYFGFTSSNNRVQIKFDIAKEDVVRWTNAIAQKLWNKVDYGSDVEMFDEEEVNSPQDDFGASSSELSSVEVKDKEEFAWS